MNDIKNAYPDEQVKLDTNEAEKEEMMRKIRATLDEYNYDIYIKMVNGLPEFDVIKLG